MCRYLLRCWAQKSRSLDVSERIKGGDVCSSILPQLASMQLMWSDSPVRERLQL